MNECLKHFEESRPKVFFSGYGFEDRTIALLSAINGKVCFDYAFTVGVPSSFVGNTLHWKRNKAFIDESLSRMAKHYEVTNVSIKQPVQVRQHLREKLSAAGIALKDYQVIVDITSFPKPTLFMLLKELISCGATGMLLYVEPIDYELPISSGVQEIRTLPFFGEDYDPKKQKLLVVILGFEGLRAYALWETFDPHKTIALLGTPSSEHEKWLRVAKKENDLILTRPNVETRAISFTDLGEAIAVLDKINQDIGNKYNVVVSTLGTKLSSIALFYFAIRHQNVFVAFSRPESLAEHYSYGCSSLVAAAFDTVTAKVVGRYSLKASVAAG